MENTNFAHDFDTIELLSGQIQGTKYANEVSAVLKEWGLDYDPSYVRYIVAQRHKVYNERIWDAITETIKRRKDRRERNAQLARELASV